MPLNSSTNCILCDSSSVQIEEVIATGALSRRYRRRFGVETETDFGDVAEVQRMHCCGCDLTFFWPQTPGGASFYQQLMRYPWYYLSDKAEYSYAAQHIQAGARVLEVGCGRGAFARHLPPVEYRGVELNPEAASAARASGLDVSCAPLEAVVTASPASFDVVCAFQVLEHVPDVATFLEQCVRAAKCGGTLIFSVPSEDSYVGALTNGMLNLPPHHMTWWSDTALRSVTHRLPLKLTNLEHEPLSALHRRAYLQAVITRAMNSRFRRTHRAFDDTWIGDAVHVASFAAAHFLAPALAHEGLSPRGHTVTVVYEKLR